MASSTFKIELFEGVNFSCPLRPAYVVSCRAWDEEVVPAFSLAKRFAPYIKNKF